MGKIIGDRRGSVAVEFAFIAPVLMLFLGGIVDFGRAFYYQTELNQALRSGMQYALKAPTDSAGIAAVISQSTNVPITVQMPATFCQRYDGSNVGCAGTCTGPGGMRAYVRLDASYAWNPLLGTMAGLVPPSPLQDTLIVRTQ